MKKIYLVDANSFIYRMFYGVPEMVTKKGEYVNAIFGIARFFLIQMKYENPDYLIFVKDAKGKNFRHDLDKNYKATRDKMPDNLKSQMPIISEMVKKMGIPIIEIEGYEADDIIGTLAKKYNGAENTEVDILTGDKDLYSLVSKNICIYDTMKKKKFGVDETIEKFGVKPESIIDFLAIVGDKADNIPGIEGFGPKKAVDLINIIGGIEEIYSLIEKEFTPLLQDISEQKDIKQLEKKIKNILIDKFREDNTKKIFGCFKGKTFEKLINSRDNAFLSKKLATIELNVDLGNFDLTKFQFLPENYLTTEIKTLFRELEFNSLIGEEVPKLESWKDLNLKVEIIDNNKELDKLFDKIKDYSEITFNIRTTNHNIIETDFIGINILLDENNIFYIDRSNSGIKISDIQLKVFIEKIFKLDLTIIGYNLKYDLEIIKLFLDGKYFNNNFKQIGLDI